MFGLMRESTAEDLMIESFLQGKTRGRTEKDHEAKHWYDQYQQYRRMLEQTQSKLNYESQRVETLREELRRLQARALEQDSVISEIESAIEDIRGGNDIFDHDDDNDDVTPEEVAGDDRRY